MMMTSTHFNAWLLSIELGTGVVIGQHFQARCAETCERIPNHHQNWRKKRFREREHSFVRLCAQNTHRHSLLRACSFYRRSYFIFGSLCTEFRWTIDTRRVVFRRFYLRLPIVNVRGRYYGWLGFSFGSESTQPSSSHFLFLSLFCVCFLLLRRGGKKKEKKKKMLMMKRRAHDDCSIYFFREEVICPY